MAVETSRRLFSREEYHSMGRAGILTEDDRIELIEGEILQMTPIGTRHAGGVNRLTELFVRQFAGRAVVTVQNPVVLDDYSEPQPDLTLLRPRADFYAGKEPLPEDVLLLVEVIETSGGYDRKRKLPLYAQAGVAEVWLLDLRTATLEVYREPSPGGYRDARHLRRGERIAPLAFPDVLLDLDALLG